MPRRNDLANYKRGLVVLGPILAIGALGGLRCWRISAREAQRHEEYRQREAIERYQRDELVAAMNSAREQQAIDEARAQKRAEPPKKPTSQVIGTGIDSPGALAVDAEAVYVASTTKGEITRVPLAGGVRKIVATGLALETPMHEPAMAADERDLYVLTSGTSDGGFEDGSLLRIAKTGDAAKPIAPKLYHPSNLVLQGDVLAWTTANERDKRSAVVWMAPRADGSPKKLHAPADKDVELCAIALDEGFAYAVEKPSEAETRLVRVPLPAKAEEKDTKDPKEGKDPKKKPRGKKGEETAAVEEVVPLGQEVGCAIAVSGGDVYFASPSGTSLARVPKAGGAVVRLGSIKTMGRAVAFAANGEGTFALLVQPSGSISAEGAIVQLRPSSFEFVATGEAGMQNLAMSPKGPVWTRWLPVGAESAIATLP